MLTPIADDLWSFEYTADMGLMQLPCRSILVRLPSGGLMLVSPGPLAPKTLSAIRELGPVEALVAPNLFHHLFLPQAMEAFPNATVFAPRGLAKKNPALSAAALTDITQLAKAWPDTVQALPIEGQPAMRETLLYHVPSKSLFITDLVFNVQTPKGLGAWLVLHAFGTYKRFATSRLIRMLTKDKAAAASSQRQLLELDIERILVAHGDNLEQNPKQQLKAALAL